MSIAFRAILEKISAALGSWMPAELLDGILRVAFVTLIGLAIVRVLDKAVRRLTRQSMPQRTAMILERIVTYGGNIAVLLAASRAAGINVSAVLGAAGIVGVAVGFAAQTSVSNVISGLFLFSERSFGIGDTIQIADVTGTVEGIDLLSIRLRTFDNRLVRIPNETMIKSNIVNVSFWPTRRLDLWLTLPHDTDVEAVNTVFMELAERIPEALADPAPLIVVDSANEDGLKLLLAVWFRQADFVALKNTLLPELLSGLAAKGIRPQARRLEVGGSSAFGPGTGQSPGPGAGSVSAPGQDWL